MNNWPIKKLGEIKRWLKNAGSKNGPSTSSPQRRASPPSLKLRKGKQGKLL